MKTFKDFIAETKKNEFPWKEVFKGLKKKSSTAEVKTPIPQPKMKPIINLKHNK